MHERTGRKYALVMVVTPSLSQEEEEEEEEKKKKGRRRRGGRRGEEEEEYIRISTKSRYPKTYWNKTRVGYLLNFPLC